MRFEEERRKAEQERRRAEEGQLAAEQERLRAEQEKIRLAEQKIRLEREKLRAEEERARLEKAAGPFVPPTTRTILVRPPSMVTVIPDVIPGETVSVAAVPVANPPPPPSGHEEIERRKMESLKEHRRSVLEGRGPAAQRIEAEAVEEPTPRPEPTGLVAAMVEKLDRNKHREVPREERLTEKARRSMEMEQVARPSEKAAGPAAGAGAPIPEQDRITTLQKEKKEAEKRARKAEKQAREAEHAKNKAEKKREKLLAQQNQMQDFLSMTKGVMAGVLQVKLIEAKGLRKSRILHHKYQPCVIVQLEKQKEVTDTASDATHPVWNAEYTFHHSQPDAKLELMVAGKRSYKVGLPRPDRHLGRAVIALADLPEGTEVDRWLPLMETESTAKRLQQKLKKERKERRRERKKDRRSGGEGSSVETMEEAERGAKTVLGEIHVKLLYRKGPALSGKAHETV